MLDDLLMRREQFPVDVKHAITGEPFPNAKLSIIPPVHPEILKSKINLGLFTQEIFEEIERNVNLDREGCKTRDYLNYEDRIIKFGKPEIDEFEIRFPQFVQGLSIEEDKISPFGGTGGIYLENKDSFGHYQEQENVLFSQRLKSEFGFEFERIGNDKLDIYLAKRNWWAHNLDTRDILIKNVVIGLNNSYVTQKYSK